MHTPLSLATYMHTESHTYTCMHACITSYMHAVNTHACFKEIASWRATPSSALYWHARQNYLLSQNGWGRIIQSRLTIFICSFKHSSQEHIVDHYILSRIMTQLVILAVSLGVCCLNVAVAVRRGEISLSLFR